MDAAERLFVLCRKETEPELRHARTLIRSITSSSGDAGVNAPFGPLGRTALHRCAIRGHRGVAAMLLAHGADPGIADKRGTTPLHEAAVSGELEICEALLDAGASRAWRGAFDVDAAKRPNGSTALHRAIRNGHAACAALLIARGADCEATSAGVHNAPTNLLLRFMPDLAARAFDTRIQGVKRVWGEVGGIWATADRDRHVGRQAQEKRRLERSASTATAVAPPTAAAPTLASRFKSAALAARAAAAFGTAGKAAARRMSTGGDALPLLPLVPAHTAGAARPASGWSRGVLHEIATPGGGAFAQQLALLVRSPRANELAAHPAVRAVVNHRWRTRVRRRFVARLRAFLALFALVTASSHVGVDGCGGGGGGGGGAARWWPTVLRAATAAVVARAWRRRPRGNEGSFPGRAYAAFLALAFLSLVFTLAAALPVAGGPWLAEVRCTSAVCEPAPGGGGGGRGGALCGATARKGRALFAAAAAVLGWVRLLHFAKGFSRCGPTLIVAQKMSRSIFELSWILLLAVVCFAHGIHLLCVIAAKDEAAAPAGGGEDGTGTAGGVAVSFRTLGASVWTCLLSLFGVMEFPIDEINAEFHLPELAACLAFGFVVCGSVLLLNLVSARMASTYERVNEEAQAEWQVALAAFVLDDLQQQRGEADVANDVPKLDILLRDWYPAAEKGGGGNDEGRRRQRAPTPVGVAAGEDGDDEAEEAEISSESLVVAAAPTATRRWTTAALPLAEPFIAGLALGCGLVAIVMSRRSK